MKYKSVTNNFDNVNQFESVLYGKNDENSENNSVENVDINNFINKYTSVLGWNYIISKRKEVSGQIGNKEDMLSSIANRQLIVGEYVSSIQDNESKFIVFNDVDGSKIDSADLHHETSIAFYPYEDFNMEYKKIFGVDFEIAKQEFPKSDNRYVDRTKYVYYLNYRAGSNGIYAKKMSTYENECIGSNCSVKVKIIFSDRFKDEFGFDTTDALITYHITNNLIALDSFKEI